LLELLAVLLLYCTTVSY